MESGGDFHYDPDQWEKMAKHVEYAGKAGGVAAKEKLETRRRDLEERVAKYKDRIERWTGVGYDGEDLRPRYKQIAKASADLKAAVSEVNFVEDSEWWGWLTDVQQERVENFWVDPRLRLSRGAGPSEYDSQCYQAARPLHLLPCAFPGTGPGASPTPHRQLSQLGVSLKPRVTVSATWAKNLALRSPMPCKLDEKRVARRRGIKIPAK